MDLKKVHESMSAHHLELGKCHAEISKCHGALAKGLEVSDPDAAASHKGIADAHKNAAQSHVEAGQFNMQCAKECDNEKSDSGDLKKLLAGVARLLEQNSLPHGLSVIPRTDRPVAVPRVGQPTDRDRDSASIKASVPEELRSIIFDDRQARD